MIESGEVLQTFLQVRDVVQLSLENDYVTFLIQSHIIFLARTHFTLLDCCSVDPRKPPHHDAGNPVSMVSKIGKEQRFFPDNLERDAHTHTVDD